MIVTLFADYAASRKRECSATQEQLAAYIRKTSAPSKDKLPWLKLARFGNAATKAGSLRHDKNVIAVTGVEADYDAGQMPFEDAVERVEKAGLECILYTSPSHHPERPRWRVLCPLNRERKPEDRAKYLGRLNGLFDGILARESWTLSQAYYFGRVDGAPDFQVTVSEGRSLDLLDELDEIWRGPPGAVLVGVAREGAIATGYEARGDAELIRRVVTGEGYHCELTALAARYIGRGLKAEPAGEILRGVMLAHPEGDRDQRWHDRYQQIEAIVSSAAGKFAAVAAAKRAVARVTHQLADHHRPAAEIKTAVIAAAEQHELDAETALAIAARILDEKVAEMKKNG